MHQVTIHEAKTHLSRLIQESLTGEDVVIANRDKPVVRLTPVTQGARERRIGGLKGLVKFMADDFDAPLEDFAEYAP